MCAFLKHCYGKALFCIFQLFTKFCFYYFCAYKVSLKAFALLILSMLSVAGEYLHRRLLSYTAVDGCCNFHRCSSCCFVPCAAPGAQTHQWAQGARCSQNCPALSHDWGVGTLSCSVAGWPGLLSGNSACPTCFSLPQDSLTGCVSSSPFTSVRSVQVPLGFGLGTSMF